MKIDVPRTKGFLKGCRRWFRTMVRSAAAFTIIELLVVVAVSAMVTGLLVLANSSTKQQVSLHIEVTKFAQVVLRAKSAALAVTDPIRLASSSSPTFAPVCGYGVHVDRAAGRYALFQYGSPLNPLGCHAQLGQIDPTDPTFATSTEEVLSDNVAFALGDPDELSEIFFMPPYPTVFISHAPFGPLTSSTGEVGTVVLESGLAPSVRTMTITMTGAGVVDF